MNLVTLRWIVVAVVIYAAVVMLRSAAQRAAGETEYAYAEGQ
jgi:hypothetical protein